MGPVNYYKGGGGVVVVVVVVCVCVCVGGYFQGEGQEKLLCKGGGSQHEKLKNKNIGGGVFCQLNLISKKAPMQKMQKNAKKKKKKKKSNIEKFFLARFTHSAFYKIHFLEQLTAMPKFNIQNIFFF